MRTGAVTKILVLRLIDMRADAVADAPAVVMLAVGDGTLSGFEITAETAALIGLDFMAKVAFAVEEEMLTGEWTEAIFGGATDIGAELDASDLTATMVALEFVLLP